MRTGLLTFVCQSTRSELEFFGGEIRALLCFVLDERINFEKSWTRTKGVCFVLQRQSGRVPKPDQELRLA